ncbi:MAG TPA: hypothetical protein VGM37_21420 [Armatimonadota bacterium]|jgi:hypothetical protein
MRSANCQFHPNSASPNERNGFTRTREWTIANGPSMRLMWRPAAKAVDDSTGGAAGQAPPRKEPQDA